MVTPNPAIFGPKAIVQDDESGLYYLQSRYYDPNIGRFINADSLIYTGQGLLGNNMFAYCSNNPIRYYDPQGTSERSVLNGNPDTRVLGAYAGAAVIGTVVFPKLMDHLLERLQNAGRNALSDIYKFSRTMRKALTNSLKSRPHVHHIVPTGDFSNRSLVTQQQIRELHSMLEAANINRYIDPMNLMLVSAGAHASLHTDQYIAHVYEYIMSTDGSREQIYLALFLLRIEIAAWDPFAIGY